MEYTTTTSKTNSPIKSVKGPPVVRQVEDSHASVRQSISTVQKTTQTDEIVAAKALPPLQSTVSRSSNSVGMSVVERLEVKFLKETVTQYSEDNSTLFRNLKDSGKVIEALKSKISSLKEIIGSGYDELRVEHAKLSFSNETLKKQGKNLDSLAQYWKSKFEELTQAIRRNYAESMADIPADEALIAQLLTENKALREMLAVNFSDSVVKKLESKVEEAESDFYNNHCSKNPTPTDLEIKFMTSNNRGFNKEFKKFGNGGTTTGTQQNEKSSEKTATIRASESASVANLVDSAQENEFLGEVRLGNIQDRNEVAQSPSTIVVEVQQPQAQLSSSLSSRAMDLKNFAESSNKLSNLMKKLEGEAAEQEKVKQSQLRILNGDEQSRGSNQVIDSSEVEIQVSELPEGDIDVEEQQQGKAKTEIAETITTNSLSQTLQNVPLQSDINASTDINEYEDYAEEEEGEDVDQEEEDEDEEYYEEESTMNDYYGYRNGGGASSIPALPPNPASGRTSEVYDFSDRARAKEMLLMQSKQLSAQMTNPKFFNKKDSC